MQKHNLPDSLESRWRRMSRFMGWRIKSWQIDALRQLEQGRK